MERYKDKKVVIIGGTSGMGFTTSIANVKGMAGNATYGAAKAALRSFARDARHRADSSRDSRQRGIARSHRHGDPRKSVSR